ncbi:MAG: transglycosylase SLT domain-containing protein [Brevinematales bacterium]|nr:transglycosylase SLT domain-containing protein [Brevinematales bacterium]
MQLRKGMNNFWMKAGVFSAIAVGLLITGICTLSGENAAQKAVDPKALGFYSEGLYRHSYEEVSKMSAPSAADFYLAARSLQELKKLADAVKYFRKIDVKALGECKDGKFLTENYEYYFPKALIDSPETYTDSLDIVSNILIGMNPKSMFYEDVGEIYLFFLWKNQKYTTLTNNKLLKLSNANPFIPLAQYMLGDKKKIDAALNRYYDIPNKSVYKTILDKLAPEDLPTLWSLKRAYTIALDLQLNGFASKLLERVYQLEKDKDYYERNKCILLIRAGEKQKAIDGLKKHIQSGKASIASFSFLLRNLKKKGTWKDAYDVVKLAEAKYPGEFTDSFVTILKNLGYADELSEWLLKHINNSKLVDKYGAVTVQTLLRKDEKKARELMDKMLAKVNDYNVLLVSALLYQERGEPEKAYPQFLRVMLYYPFTYEWVVAMRYEPALREKYPDVFDKILGEWMKWAKNQSMKKMLQVYLGFAEADPIVFEKQIGMKNIGKQLTSYRTSMKGILKASKEIPEVAQAMTLADHGWNLELFKYVEAALDKVCRNTKDGKLDDELKWKYTYHYKEVYRALKLWGNVVSRFNTWSFSLIGGRMYHPVLPKESFQDLYPLMEFDMIVKTVGDTNRTLWMLSSFREESHFRKLVTSWVGAVGYAQVMPYTAEGLKKNMKEPYLELRDFEDNIRMGMQLFNYLFKLYGDNYAFALGAYNAGEGAVNKWKTAVTYKNELWIECILYDETRNYVKRIMLTRYYYSMLYGFPKFKYVSFH